MAWQVSLRKAHSLQQQLKEASSGLGRKRPETEVDAMVSPDYLAECKDMEVLYQEYVAEKLAIMDAIMEIRNDVALMNAKVGITIIMGEMATLDAKISLYETIVDQGPTEDSSKVAKMIERQNKKDENGERSYISSNDVEVSIFSEEFVEDATEKLHKLKIEKRRHEDRIMEMNFRTTIELTTSTWSLLGKLGLVD